MWAAAAANHVLAANVGVTLFLITAEEPDLALTDHWTAGRTCGRRGRRRRPGATSLHSLGGAEDEIGQAEVALLRKWLGSLAGGGSS
jgi:hypothetical protein